MDVTVKTPYELMVQRNIEENRKVLRNLGFSDSHEVPRLNKTKPRRTRTSFNPKPVVKEPETRVPTIRTRRSSLLKLNDCDKDCSYTVDEEENTPPHKKRRVVREPSFGEIEGVRVGDWWMTRMECSAAGVHRPTVAGIHGKVGEGCYSIALSGGYEDDLDCGDFFTYTGCGGRDLKGTKANPKNLRTAPQSKDQVLDGNNAALAFSIESKKPVRVIRGYKLQSPYAPEDGYRYDGLYSVEKYWTAQGLSGFKVIKFALKRLTDQDPPFWETYPMLLSPEKNQLKKLSIEEPATPDDGLLLPFNGFPEVEKPGLPTEASLCLSNGFPLPNTSENSPKIISLSPQRISTRNKSVSLLPQSNGLEKVFKTKEHIPDSEFTLKDSLASTNGVPALERNNVPNGESLISKESLSTSSGVSLLEIADGSTKSTSNSPESLRKYSGKKSVSPSTKNKKIVEDSIDKNKEYVKDDFGTEVNLISREESQIHRNVKTGRPGTKTSLSPSKSPKMCKNSKQNGETPEPIGNTLESNNKHVRSCIHLFSESENSALACNLNESVKNVLDSSNIVTPLNIKSPRSSTLKLNCKESHGQEMRSDVTPLNSSEKKVRFSPKLHFIDTKQQDAIKPICLFNSEEDIVANDTSDDGSKKQASILKYFTPVRKTFETQQPKSTVNPKSLRSNRISSFSMSFEDNQSEMNKNSMAGLKNADFKSEFVNGVLTKTPKSPGSSKKSFKSSSQKRKYKSLHADTNRRENCFDSELSKCTKESRPTVMLENLLKKNKTFRLNKQKQTSPKGRKSNLSCSPMKECSVKLLRIEESFLGWDYEIGKFQGFVVEADKNDGSTGKPISFEKGFPGWDPCKTQGAKSLVTIAFLIDTLSNNDC